MTVFTLKPTEFWPSAARAGTSGQRIFRMQNIILRSEGDEPFAEVYSGSKDLNENIPTSTLTGTLTTSTTSYEVVGAGTAFLSELHQGQFIEAFSGATRVPMVVDEITDNTHMRVCRLPGAAVAGASAFRFPVMFEMDKKRGTLIWGNAVKFDKGTLLCVGNGTLRINGAVLPGASLVASEDPQIAIYDSGVYSVFPLGMDTPATLSAADQAGGTKQMVGGLYSIRAAPARLATKGYNNPSPKAEVTLTDDHKIRVTVGAADTANGQDGWMFFGTLYAQGGGENGPWYRIELPVTIVPVGSGPGEIPAAGGTYDIEFNDAEISSNDLLTFDNDPPPPCEFIGVIGGIPVFVSCHGLNDLPPGPYVAPAKRNNIEAAPAAYRVCGSPPDTIIGQVGGAQGRLYLMCTNSLQIALATQATDPRIPPVSVRPYWRSGFKNTESLLFVSDVLVGMTTNGLVRSIAEGDEGSEEFGFATAMEDLLRFVSPGHCLLKLDPKNNAVVLFHSAHSLNSAGFWTTRAWMYSLRQHKWIGDVLLTSNTGDMIVSSAATVNDRLEFLCGGRQQDGTTVVRTYRWDEPVEGDAIPYFLAWEFSDAGIKDRTFAVKSIMVAGDLSLMPSAYIYGAGPGESIPTATLETPMSVGANGLSPGSKSGPITLPFSFDPTQRDFIGLDVDNLKQYSVKVEGVWTVSFIDRDRIDEVLLEIEPRGARR